MKHLKDLPYAPDWLLAAARSTRMTPRQTPANVELDTPQAIDRAEAYLDSRPIDEEGNRNNAAYQTACRVKDFGCSEHTTLGLLLTNWQCDPPLSEEELQIVVGSAYKTGKNAPGSSNPAADFEPIDPAEIFGTDKPKNNLFYVLAKDVKLRTKAASLVKGLLDQGALSVFYGGSGIGKSFLVYSLAWAIASRAKDWFGFPVRKHGAVLYIASEGGTGNYNRIHALKIHSGVTDAPLALVPCMVDLLRPNADTQHIIDLIKQIETETGLEVVLTVVDTLARATGGADESSSVDMGAFVKNLDRIRSATSSHVLVVHHTGKDEARGARGWSGVRGAVDTEVAVSKGQVSVKKQRDAEEALPFGFALKSMVFGQDSEGDEIKSAVAVPASLAAAAEFELTGQAEAAFSALVVAVAEKGVEPEQVADARVMARCTTVDAWREVFYDKCGLDATSARVTFHRQRKALTEGAERCVVEHNGYVWPVPS